MTGLPRKYQWAVTALLSSVALAYLFYVFLPQMHSIREIRLQLSSKHDAVAQESKLSPTVGTVRCELEATQRYVVEQEARLIRSDELPRMFGQISQIVNASGVKATRFEPQPAVAFENFRKVPITLSFDGSSLAVEQVIQRLESLPRTVWIEELKIDAPRENGETVKAELQLAVFINNREISD